MNTPKIDSRPTRRRTLAALGVTTLAATTLFAGSDSETPLHEKLLRMLRTETPLQPELADVHPLHTIYNREAVVPPQCYTRTEGQYNPCYVCHQDHIAGRENRMDDADLQLAYTFSDVGFTNRWSNLFEDRTERVAAISDEQILDWIRTDNYSELAPRLRATDFEGWIPDLEGLERGAAAFDDEGFAQDGSQWVAFNYKPVPSTFWPTNGSTDDVMIRLAEPFRTDEKGNPSRDVYKANLAILEAKIKGLASIDTHPIDEKAVGRDLDGDRRKRIATRITRTNAWVGAARGEAIETFLYPQGTEFLHTVRYVGLGDDGTVGVSTRMKEVRYMKKWRWYGKPAYGRQYQLEQFEKDAGHLPGYQGIGDHGLDNSNGWSVQGFIEGRDGRLRTLTYEENFACMGCHNTVGATIDKTFSFARKVDGAKGWTYIDLRGMPDAPNMGETKGEFATYFERVGGGDEFRSNEEMLERWFVAEGQVDHVAVAAAADVYELITPSPERALQLNKAYRVLVEDQDFIFGRDATVTAPINVYDAVDPDTAPTLPEEKTFTWDIRLDWGATGAGDTGS